MTKILVYKNDPWINRAIALSITRKKEPIEEIIKECEEAGVEKCREYVQRIVGAPRDSPPVRGYGHRIGMEFGDTLLILNPSRFEALRIWREANALNGIRISGLERSLRIQKPPFECVDKESKYLHDMALPVYEEFVKKGIVEEDARFLLPEGVKTTIIFDASANRIRDLAKLANSFGDFPLPEEHELRSSLEEIVRKELGFIPRERGFSQWDFDMPFEEWKRKVGYGEKKDGMTSNLFSGMLNLDLDGSLSMYAQAVRLRLGLVEIEPVISIAARRKFEIPPSFGEGERREYYRIAKEAANIQQAKLGNGDSTFVYSFLLGQKARAEFHLNAAHAPYVITQRACGAAQWEIRNKLGIPLYEMLKDREKVGPRCITAAECWEPRTSRCPVLREWPYLGKEQIVERLKTYSEELEIL